LLTRRSLQTCQGSGVGSIPIGRSRFQRVYATPRFFIFSKTPSNDASWARSGGITLPPQGNENCPNPASPSSYGFGWTSLWFATEPHHSSDVGSSPIDQSKILKSLRRRPVFRIFQIIAGEAGRVCGFLHRGASSNTLQGQIVCFGQFAIVLLGCGLDLSDFYLLYD